jgi:UPF0716 protein FxsA
VLGKLLLAFVLVPLVDLYVLFVVADRIGGLETVALVVLTGVIGGTLAKIQGVQTMRRLRYRAVRGEPPSRELADGALILFGGALLLTPGLMTDGVGFALLLPFVRPRIRSALSSYLGDAFRRDGVVVEVGGADGDVDAGGDRSE